MENRVQQPTPVQTHQFRIVRIGAEPLQRRSSPPAHISGFNPPHQAAKELETPSQFAEDHSPAARARKARRRLRRLFDAARRKAKGRARLCRADEYEVCGLPIERSAHGGVMVFTSRSNASCARRLKSRLAVAPISSSC